MQYIFSYLNINFMINDYNKKSCYKSLMGLLRNLDILWFSCSFGFNALMVFSQKSLSIRVLSLGGRI